MLPEESPLRILELRRIISVLSSLGLFPAQIPHEIQFEADVVGGFARQPLRGGNSIIAVYPQYLRGGFPKAASLQVGRFVGRQRASTLLHTPEELREFS